MAESTLERMAFLKLQIEQLQQHIKDDAGRLQAQVDQHLDHPGGLRYVVELAQRIQRDAGWMQERVDEMTRLEQARDGATG